MSCHLFLCFCRKITPLQINHKIWLLTKSGKVSCDHQSCFVTQFVVCWVLLDWCGVLSIYSLLAAQPPLYFLSVVCCFLHRKANRTGGVEFKQDVMKSRSNGAQAKRALFERMNTEPTKYLKCFPSISSVPDIQNILSHSGLYFSWIDQRIPSLNWSALRVLACPVPVV